jgi:predicted Rossmann fold flavoprotein
VSRSDVDVAIVGAGAAGLAAAVFTRTRRPDLRVALLDGAKKPGAKILVSGGSRCNVTNTVVTARDFNGGPPAIVRRVLRALPVKDTVAFFHRLGVPLHEEPGGKLFPDSHRSQTVLDALLREAGRLGVQLRFAHRVVEIARDAECFRVVTTAGTLGARAVVLATGGLSLPKTGSDGWGYDAAARLGHTLVPTTPALVPLVLDAGSASQALGEGRASSGTGAGVHRVLSGVSLPVQLDVRVDGRRGARVNGSLLWTHFGVSGPAVLDASRHWLRARLEGHEPGMRLSLCPGETFESMERAVVDLARVRPRLMLQSAVAERVPASVAMAWIEACGLRGAATMAELTRDGRRALIHALLDWTLPVRDSRGYNHAEVTAGGVPLTEIDPSTMASRCCAGLVLVGEILDVDGRIGGFNFQWAWSSAHAAAEGVARTLP